MKRLLWSLAVSGLMACSGTTMTTDTGTQSDAGSTDVTADSNVHDTGTTLDAIDAPASTDVAMDTGNATDTAPDSMDSGPTRMCPATCTTPADCTATCPPATLGGWCCNGGSCVAAPVCSVPTDAGPDALVCTGAGQCDATHACPTGEHCCSPLPGLHACGTCSPGVCPG